MRAAISNSNRFDKTRLVYLLAYGHLILGLRESTNFWEIDSRFSENMASTSAECILGPDPDTEYEYRVLFAINISSGPGHFRRQTLSIG